MQSPQDPRPFFKNMLKSVFNTKVSNSEEISSPVVEAIRENTEAVKDKETAKQMSKPIVNALVDVMEKMDEKKEFDESNIDRLFSHVQKLKVDKLLDKIETVKGDPGNDGHTPTKEELIPIIEPLIKPLIPDPIPGKDGKDYILTSKDKKEIAKSIEVPIVEKIVETIVEKQPIVTNEIKEVAVAEEAPKIKEKLESLEGDERLDAKAIKNLPKANFGGGGGIKRIDGALDTRIITPTNGQTLVWNASRGVWENSSSGGGGGGGSVDSVVAGNNIDVDATDPANPIVSVETLTLADISDVTASATEVNYTDGVTSAIQTQLNAKAPSTAPTFATSITGSYLTASELLGTGASKEIVSLPVATYPSLTELTYVKGVTSAIQTQLGTKQATIAFGTGVQTALGVNVGSAGAPVLFNGALGTPSSGTLTNASGLPLSGVVDSTSEALGVGTLELGHASDTTISRSAAGMVAVEGIRVLTTTPLVVSAASYTTDTGTSLNMDNLDMFVITAQAGALLFNSPGGTLVQGRKLTIRIKDNGTAQALTWNAVFRAMGTALPSTTVLSKTLYLGFIYNSTDTKFDLVASAQEL